MGSLLILFVSLILFVLAYIFYGRFVADRVFRADDRRVPPSVELRDDIDYVPTNKEVLFGHHFASIAGTGPIVGPAIAVIWGWLPALVWIIIGSIFAGAVHDYAALMMSTRNKGVSIGELSRCMLGKRGRILFLLLIFFSLWIVVAIFGMVMAVIFEMYPQSVFPVWIQIPIAVCVGWLAYRRGSNLTVLSVIAVALMYLSIAIGVNMPIHMPSILGIPPLGIWVILLLVYAYVASVLPVWTLLQPRDYINSHQLVIGIALLALGILLARPEIVAPVINVAPKGAPPMLPFIFITIACGAISGFHALVGSGTSSKQVRSERDVKFVGFGGMLTEGFLGVLVLIAVAAGIGMSVRATDGSVLNGVQAWQYHYSSWSAMQGLSAKVTAFVNGAANMMTSLKIPVRYGQAIIGVLVASFTGTTLDTATRIQRYIVSEIAVESKIKILQKRHPATLFVVLLAGLLAFSQGAGSGALVLWPLFGTSNQLLAGLVLLVASVYLVRERSKAWITIVPMFFMMLFSVWAIIINIAEFTRSGKILLAAISLTMLFFSIWMFVEAVKVAGTKKEMT
ncbi:MAG: carbon starvation protein A [Candidatus Omnitrophica bacterium]|nr:carbon starvation protein A [Candidatus Omnitrophota bacterium]MDD5487497.1 carbon starvation protein A [Candidatus Omnitrophota bacterium]